MVIRARIAWFLARPLLFPITIAGAGLTYGTFKITRGVFHKVLGHHSEEYSKTSYLLGFTGSLGIIGIRESPLLLPETISNNGSDGSKSSSSSFIANLQKKGINLLKSLHAPYRAKSCIAGAILAAAIIEIHHKSLQDPNKKEISKKE